MQTMTAALIELVVDGEVEEEIAAAAAPNRHDFPIALGRAQKEAVVERDEAAEAAKTKPGRARDPRRSSSPRTSSASSRGRRGRGSRGRRSRSRARGRQLPERRRRAGAAAALDRPSGLRVHVVLGSRSRWYDNIPLALVRAAARPLPSLRARRSRVRYPAVEALTALLDRRLRAQVRSQLGRADRGVLLRRARRRLGDRRRAPDHPEPDRPAGGRGRARRATRSCTRRSSGSPRASAPALFLFLAALAYPAGMGMGDVKLALLLGVALGRTVPVAMMIGMLSALVPVDRAARPARQRGAQDGDPVRAVPGPRRRRRPVCRAQPPPRVPRPAVMESSVNLDNQPDLRLVDGEGEPEDIGAPEDGRRPQRPRRRRDPRDGPAAVRAASTTSSERGRRDGSFSQALVDEGLASSLGVARRLAEQYQLPLVDLAVAGVDAEAAKIDRAARARARLRDPVRHRRQPRSRSRSPTRRTCAGSTSSGSRRGSRSSSSSPRRTTCSPRSAGSRARPRR